MEDDYRDLVRRCGIPTVAAFCWGKWTDPLSTEDEIVRTLHEAHALRDAGGETLVVGCGARSRPEGYTDAEFERVASALIEVARGGEKLGLRVGVHPHTRTGIETRAEIDAILSATALSPLGFAPDSGQIAKGGSDVVEVFSTYLSRITHVHLKDWSGVADIGADGQEVDSTGYLNYTPIGDGVVPIEDVLTMLDDAGFDGWVNVELDGTESAPMPPKEAAARSKAYLQRTFGSRIAWAPARNRLERTSRTSHSRGDA
jgi:inosose dehydratase